MVDEVEETDSPRSLADLLSNGLTILQAVTPYPAGIDDRNLLKVSGDIGFEAQHLSIMQRDSSWLCRGFSCGYSARHILCLKRLK